MAPAADSAPHRSLRGDVWLWLTLLVGAISAASFLIKAWSTGPVIQDDARQFLAWTSRWRDPDLLRGDLLADYWQSVTPWFYKAVFWTASELGLEPLVFVRILPVVLCLTAALFAFRFLRAIGAEPFAAFVTTALLLMYFTNEGTLVNGTPGSFSRPLMLIALDGLARKKVLQTALAQLFLAGCYPQAALVMATVIGGTMIAPRSRYFLDLGRHRLAIVGTCALATIVGILPFLLQSGQFSPIVTLNEALQLPTFGVGGRNQITKDGTIDFLCGGRLGVFGSKCRGPVDFLLLLGLIAGASGLLAARTVRAQTGRIASTLPLLFFVASLVWFAISSLVLFRLHLPSRYTGGLFFLGILMLVPLVLEWGRAALARWRISRTIPAVVIAVLAVAAVATVKLGSALQTPADRNLIAAIRALPQDAVVAGFVSDLDFSPVLTDRSTLFSRELTIGYHLGYLRPMTERMEDIRDVIVTHDASVLTDRLEKNNIDVLLVYPETLAEPRVPRAFRGFFGADLAAAEQASAREGETVLARLAKGCVKNEFKTVLALDAGCLVDAAKNIR